MAFSGSVHDLTYAPIKDWIRVYNCGRGLDGKDLTKKDLLSLIRKDILKRENLLIEYDGAVPSSCASIVYDDSHKTIGLSDFVVIPGHNGAGVKLIDKILGCARRKGYHRVVAWMRSGESQASDTLGLFIFDLHQIRVYMGLSLIRSFPVPDRFNVSRVATHDSKLGDFLHEGYLSVGEIRDILSTEWHMCSKYPLDEPDSYIVGFCSNKSRRHGMLFVDTSDPTDPIQPLVHPDILLAALHDLYSLGVRYVSSEISADRDTRAVFESLGFSVHYTLYRLIFDIVR